MAIEKNIPQDTRKYEPKFIWQFTMRQFFCFMPAAAAALFICLGLRGSLSLSARIFISLAVAVPFVLIGWYKPYNMPFEKYAWSVFKSMVLSPAVRKYRTERLIPNQTLSPTAQKKKKRRKITDPNFIGHK